MNTGRAASPGKTRTCPHCKATILESASVCPGCNHHLRYEPGERAQPTVTPLKVDGKFRHPASATEPWEYSVVVAVRNARGEEISRQVVGVGALQPDEERSFTIAVEVFSAQDAKDARAAGKEIPAPAKESAQVRSSAPSKDPRPPAPPPAHAKIVPASSSSSARPEARAASRPAVAAPREPRQASRLVRSDSRPGRSTNAGDSGSQAPPPPPGEEPDTLPQD